MLCLVARRTATGPAQRATAPQSDRAAVQQQIKHWQQDRDLAGVRDKDALAKLPSPERAAWEKLWADVAMLFKMSEKPSAKE